MKKEKAQMLKMYPLSSTQTTNKKTLETKTRKITKKERKYLKLGGINHDGFTQEEKLGFLDSLDKKEKEEFDEYDEKAKVCPYCIGDGTVNTVVTKRMKRCPNCGNINNLFQKIEENQ